MKFNKPLLALLFAASLAGMTQSSVATAEVRIFLNDAPPALRYEPAPSPRRGYVGTWLLGFQSRPACVAQRILAAQSLRTLLC
jgi:hypothetical protein